MDYLSMTIGFIVGTCTGAAGTYFGNKYTDQRQRKELAKEQKEIWKDICTRFPNVINEMKDDFKEPKAAGVRKFFVKTSTSRVNSSEACFSYHTDIHKDLNAAILYLLDKGYIEDITPGNCPMYRFYEHFVDKLKRA